MQLHKLPIEIIPVQYEGHWNKEERLVNKGVYDCVVLAHFAAML